MIIQYIITLQWLQVFLAENLSYSIFKSSTCSRDLQCKHKKMSQSSGWCFYSYTRCNYTPENYRLEAKNHTNWFWKNVGYQTNLRLFWVPAVQSSRVYSRALLVTPELQLTLRILTILCLAMIQCCLILSRSHGGPKDGGKHGRQLAQVEQFVYVPNSKCILSSK